MELEHYAKFFLILLKNEENNEIEKNPFTKLYSERNPFTKNYRSKKVCGNNKRKPRVEYGFRTKICIGDPVRPSVY